jgi:hypothetical protein
MKAIVAAALSASVVVLAAACSSGGPASSAAAVSDPSATTATSAADASQPFPNTPATALPAGTVRIAVPGGNFGDFAGPGNLVVGNGYVWTSGLHRIDPRTNTASVALTTNEAFDIATGGGSVWASDYDAGIVHRYDPTTGRSTASIPVAAPVGITATPGAIWVLSHHDSAIDRIDMRTNTITDKINLEASFQAHFIAAGPDSVWIDAGQNANVYRVDLTGKRAPAIIDFAKGNPCGGIAASTTAVWASDCDDTTLSKIDPHTNSVVTAVDVGGIAIGLAIGSDDSVWFVTGADPHEGSVPAFLVQLSATGTVLHKYAIGSDFTTGGIGLGYGSIWISNSEGPTVLRIPLPSH